MDRILKRGVDGILQDAADIRLIAVMQVRDVPHFKAYAGKFRDEADMSATNMTS